jgi:predicted RND superfamily exporter protein
LPETAPASLRLAALFRQVVRWRHAILAAYALLVPLAGVLALRIPTDNAIERMIVASDADYAATRAFERVFPESPTVLLLAEADDPFAPESLAAFRALDRALAKAPRVTPVSALSIAERLRPGLSLGPQGPTALRLFLTGTSFFRRQALLGDRFLGLALRLDVSTPAERDVALAGIEPAIAAATGPHAFRRIRRIGEPFVSSYLERQTREASARYFPLFGLFVVALNLFLYRSARALAAILLTLGVSVLFGVSLGGVFGFSFTIVSSLVPLTLMVTSSSTLVYLHSRFVDRPEDVAVDEHQVFALANKWKAVTVSTFATAVGFAALAVSKIHPVREMGLWTAAGLVVGWAVSFTLFPVLQKLLRTPTRRERAIAGAWVIAAAERLPRWSYRWRFALVLSAAGLCLAGMLAVFGFPGLLRPMPLETDSLDYVDPAQPLYQDTRAFAREVSGLTSFTIWITTPPGRVLDASFLAGLDRFASALEREPGVGAVSGLPSVLRLRRYAAGQPEAFPEDPRSRERTAAELEQLLLREPGLRSLVDVGTLASARLDVRTRAGSPTRIADLAPVVRRLWEEAGQAEPLLARSEVQVVGQGLLAEKIGAHLVPTLVQSLAVTGAIIFSTFFFVFRSGAARLMAMVPSIFAILVMFLLMRLFGVSLNVATILIATTVLGATESDQVHFFYHFHEKRREATTERALAHAIRVAGSAIFFATLVNTGGFLALALSDLPPMRQFGTLTATAFVLALLADFTALPAALWIVFGARPDVDREAAGPLG